MNKLLLLSVLLVPGFAVAQTNPGAEITTTLTQVREEPEAFKNVKIRFTVQFCSLGNLSNPFFTQFTPTEYVNFHAWADEQPIWQKSSYEDVFGMLFYGKNNDDLGELCSTSIYQRLEVSGVVRNTFQNIPWIEVTSFRTIDGSVDTATLAHLYRGEQHMQNRRWQRAVSEFSLANTENAPTSVLFAVQKNLGICNLRMGEAEAARTHLSAASEINSSDLQVKRLLATASEAPSSGLDRSVDKSSVKEHERPLWEAFASTASATKSNSSNQTKTVETSARN